MSIQPHNEPSAAVSRTLTDDEREERRGDRRLLAMRMSQDHQFRCLCANWIGGIASFGVIGWIIIQLTQPPWVSVVMGGLGLLGAGAVTTAMAWKLRFRLERKTPAKTVILESDAAGVRHSASESSQTQGETR